MRTLTVRAMFKPMSFRFATTSRTKLSINQSRDPTTWRVPHPSGSSAFASWLRQALSYADSKAFARTKGTSSPSTRRSSPNGVVNFAEHQQGHLSSWTPRRSILRGGTEPNTSEPRIARPPRLFGIPSPPRCGRGSNPNRPNLFFCGVHPNDFVDKPRRTQPAKRNRLLRSLGPEGIRVEHASPGARSAVRLKLP